MTDEKWKQEMDKRLQYGAKLLPRRGGRLTWFIPLDRARRVLKLTEEHFKKLIDCIIDEHTGREEWLKKEISRLEAEKKAMLERRKL